ncbi:hypothetical protein [Inovirus D_HF3_8]|nr:hypothetical protein [Inovirus D_HF3_8]
MAGDTFARKNALQVLDGLIYYLVYCAPLVASADGEFKIKFPLPQHKQEGA